MHERTASRVLPERAASLSRGLPQRNGGRRRSGLLAAAGVCVVVVLALVGLGTQSSSETLGSRNPPGQFRHLSSASASSGSSSSAGGSSSSSYSLQPQTPVNRAFSALSSALSGASQQPSRAAEPSTYARGPTLVLYAYSTDDPLHTANFAYFLRWGMTAGRDLEYLVAVRKQASMRTSICSRCWCVC